MYINYMTTTTPEKAPAFVSRPISPTHLYSHHSLYQAFYHHHDSGETSRKLKRSLSDALATYYPLAGRIRENSWVDCNDAGAEYVEAWFNNVQLSDVIEKSGTEELKQYVPVEPCGGGDVPLAVQVSFFSCGGTAIGLCLSHRVADAMSLVTFINAWAAACRGETKTIALTQPTFSLASRFPPADFSKYFPSGALPPPRLRPDEKIRIRRTETRRTEKGCLRANDGETNQSGGRLCLHLASFH
ncbi:UNVERIFIED_CONTAM: Stemmadenine O-acetyltransferase [Sesamum angustifolium]|uniref:Stemmadenine O-acetyltransferase n=1 Tax=Sesamum angustifolium TaxID=2727405 RepID=A0AAW2KMK4_9LAMI